MRQMTVMDADDDNIEAWITVRGNHIPIMKGQSKEDAVKSFIEKKGGSEEKVDNEKIKKAINKVGSAVNERKADEKTTIKNLTKEMGLNNAETQKLNEFFGTGEGKAKYPAEFETVRKNAKANPYLYDLRYTQKSKAKAYEEYKKDTEKEAPTPAQQHATTRNIMTLFSKHYEDLYDGKTKYNRELVKEFDDKMANDPEFKKQVQAFVRERGDVLSSDREVQAYMMAYNTTKSKLEPAMKKLERAHGQTHFTYTDPDGLNFRVFESSNDPGWKSSNLPTESFKSKEEAIAASKERLKSDKLKYGDFNNKRNKEFLYNTYKKGFQESEPEMGNPNKTSDSPLVNAVARSLNMSAENAEKEVNGAVQHIKDLIKAKDLRNGDVEETLQGLGIESDYAEEFMEWVSAPTKKKATTSKKKKEPALVREGNVNWVDPKVWNDPRSDPWYALYE